MKKKYLSDLIGNNFYQWHKKYVFIKAPTGIGKSKFSEHVLIPYYKMLGKKVCILCNRRALTEQYRNDLLWYYRVKSEMDDDVEVLSYQYLAQCIKNGDDIKRILSDFDLIICDEAHYFYSDSDFNMLGTYVLLQELVAATFYKTVILLSATMDEVEPLIKKCINSYMHYIKFKHIPDSYYGEYDKQKIDSIGAYGEVITVDYSMLTSYTYLIPMYYEDIDALVENIVTSEKKSLVFLDDKSGCERIEKKLLTTGKIKNNQILRINSELMDNSYYKDDIAKMLCTHIIPKKVLLTTSVLDNGFSIHDNDVENIVIMTESRISFLQMLGRVRNTNGNKINLVFLKRDSNYFQRRIEQYEGRLGVLEVAETKINNPYYIINEGWFGNDDDSVFLRNICGFIRNEFNIYDIKRRRVYIDMGEYGFTINRFAKEKIGDMLIEEKRLYQLSLEDPIKVALYQIGWLGMDEKDLVLMGGTYKDQKLKEFREELLCIKDYDKDQFIDVKRKIIKKYSKTMFPDIVARNSLDHNKFTQICEKYNLEFKISRKDNKTYYSVFDKLISDEDIEYESEIEKC